MAIDVDTRDCTAVSDADLEEMADICVEGRNPYSVGFLSKQTEAWVLLTTARDGARLKGFSFCTLERIGGTPSVIVGASSVARTSKRDTALRAMVTDQMRRALLAFPDEDVLVGTRIQSTAGFEVFRSLGELIPRPDHRANGEQRAWGKRLAKRYDIPASAYDDRTFVALGDGSQQGVFDHDSLKPEKLPVELEVFFEGIELDRGDSLVAHGWAMAEALVKLG
jgi:hypothetical protein